jgi:SAM-dependent methyltransferase
VTEILHFVQDDRSAAMPLLDFLKLPEAKNIHDLDAPEATLLHREIIKKKPFLKNLYLDFYRIFERFYPDLHSRRCVELGSGGGFIKEVFPNMITSDILSLPGLDKVFSALDMPFETSSVDAFFMIDVFHHVPDSHKFLSELSRCLRPGGKIVMIEPASTLWGRFIYKNFHHEPFEPESDWKLSSEGGPLTCANGALPWIVFVRDRPKLNREFPELILETINPHTPLRYLLSGGVSMKQLLPSFCYQPLKTLEFLLTPLNPLIGMFYTIVLNKKS